MILHDKKLSGSAINNYTAAIINYHRMIDQPVKLPFLKLNNSLPYYFDETDILKIFSVCSNLKHFCMLKVLFFGCLRSGELCKLNVPDYDPDDLTLRLRETKNASDAIAFINDETAHELNKYLQIKPKLEIDGYELLFITDYCHRWTPTKVLQMFMNYKEKAGIEIGLITVIHFLISFLNPSPSASKFHFQNCHQLLASSSSDSRPIAGTWTSSLFFLSA